MTALAPAVYVPSDLAVALEAAPRALHFFEALTDSQQRRVVRRIEDAGSVELRRRRIERAVRRLLDERRPR